MTLKNYFIIIVLIIAVIFVVSMITCPKRPETPVENGYYDEYGEIEPYDLEPPPQEKQEEYRLFYKKPASLWPKITIGGTFTAVIVFVALTLGIVSYFIGYNAGGKENKGQIFFAIGTATGVGILGRSATIFIEVKLYDFFVFIFSENPIIAGTLADAIIYVLWIVFIAGISVYLYETFTVTAKEIHPMG